MLRNLIHFYRFWHGTLHLKGAGLLLRFYVQIFGAHPKIKLALPEKQTISLDFHDISAITWLNHSLGDSFQEHGLIKAILSLSEKPSTLWDIGANCGLFSYHLAKARPSWKILFFEPNPMMFELASTALNPFSQVKGYPIALSDNPNNALLVIPRGASTVGTIEVCNKGNSLVDVIQVVCNTGDDFLQTSGSQFPDFIKIDTEGHEASVIRGMVNLISTYKPVIFFEHISLSDEEVFNLLPTGYEIFCISSDNGLIEKGFNRKNGHNSALFPREKVPIFLDLN
jgi:FkbM family methyltransferase